MRRVILSLVLITGLLISLPLSAKKAEKIWEDFQKTYSAAEMNYGLKRATVAPDPNKWGSFVVLMKGGLPAQRAEFYIGWGDYDYRGVTIEGDEVKTRRGKIYTFLKKGDVLAVVDTDRLGGTLYMKLITPEVYVPENRQSDKRHSRVTCQVAFKLPKEIYNSDDVAAAMNIVGEWFKPFTTLDAAKEFSQSILQAAN